MLRNVCIFPQYRVLSDIKEDAGGRVNFQAGDLVPENGIYNNIYCFAFDKEAEFILKHVKKNDIVYLSCEMKPYKGQDGVIRQGFKVKEISLTYSPSDNKPPIQPREPKPESNAAQNSHFADFAKMLQQYRK